jgi:hypothetical protein
MGKKMFAGLDEYKEYGRFTFDSTMSLSVACNAPKDKSGIYLVYALAEGQIELVYIGS